MTSEESENMKNTIKKKKKMLKTAYDLNYIYANYCY